MQTPDRADVCTTPKTPAEYLASLPVCAWDGIPRLDTWLPHVLGELPKTAGMLRVEYLGLVGLYLVLGMVRRAVMPGCKFDYFPVLAGGPGLGKSTLLEVLAGRKYFSDMPIDMQRDGQLAQAPGMGVWLHEIAELSALNKADVGDLTFLINSTHDRYRPAYSASVKITPRKYVIVGTTNDDTRLKNLNASRRVWLVPVRHPIDIDWVAKHRDQLFAEALSRFAESESVPNLGNHPGSPSKRGVKVRSQPLPTVALLPEGGRILRPLIGGKNLLPLDGNYISIATPTGDARIFLERHPEKTTMRFSPECIGRWAGLETRKDTTGASWQRCVYYVTSDTGLGDLVEVPK